MKSYFIAGINTDVGKTLVSSLIVESLKADYWKPVQSGLSKDSDFVLRFISNPSSIIHPEVYHFKTPVSPHSAAKIENQEIQLDKIILPEVLSEYFVIESAGGLLVPLNNRDFIIDLAKKFNAEIVLVCRNYLGCINHTLLTINYLKQNNFNIKALVFNGDFPEDTKTAILNFAKIQNIIELSELSDLDEQSVVNWIDEHCSHIREVLS